MANLDIYGQPQGQGESWPAIRRALQDLARGVSYYPYDLLGAPVDVANLALSAVGLGSKEPVLGSDQLRRISQQLGFAQPSTGSTAETVGRFAAGLTNPAAPVRAVQRVAEPTEDALRQIVREIQTTPPRGSVQLPEAGLLDEAADISYRGTHTAPDASVYGATLDDLTKIMPKDVYTQQGKRLYGIGDNAIDREWYMAALRAKGKPDAEVTIYRAVPKGVKDINAKDWVTTSEKYAQWHGDNVLDGDFEIIKKTVKAKTLSSEGYPYEFGYNP